jgi:hypothetical protein
MRKRIRFGDRPQALPSDAIATTACSNSPARPITGRAMGSRCTTVIGPFVALLAYGE